MVSDQALGAEEDALKNLENKINRQIVEKMQRPLQEIEATC